MSQQRVEGTGRRMSTGVSMSIKECIVIAWYYEEEGKRREQNEKKGQTTRCCIEESTRCRVNTCGCLLKKFGLYSDKEMMSLIVRQRCRMEFAHGKG